MEFNVNLQLAGLLEWMDQQMKNCGGKTAVIGISGGKDSSTVAALAVAAYGRENVYGVLMPDGVQPDIDYSNGLVDVLNIPHTTINIHDAVQGVLREMERVGLTPSRQTTVNLPSRVRMATLYAVAQTLPGGIVINTSNLSEDWVGYCTLYGDSAGAFSPLGMYTTEEVIALGRALGLPEKFLVKAPSDGLTGLTDEDNLGFTYHAVNEYIRKGVCDPEIKKQIDAKHKASRFKFETLPVYHNGLTMVLVMGTSPDYPPYEFYSDSAMTQFAGIDVEVAKYIAESMGMELQIEAMNFDNLVTSLSNGDFDMVLAACEYTDERALACDFSDPYYTDLPPVILVKESDADKYKTLDDINKASVIIGAQKNTTKASAAASKFPEAANGMVLESLVPTLVTELKSGKIDLPFCGKEIAPSALRQMGQFAISPVGAMDVRLRSSPAPS